MMSSSKPLNPSCPIGKESLNFVLFHGGSETYILEMKIVVFLAVLVCMFDGLMFPRKMGSD